jgi:hypothetical protein
MGRCFSRLLPLVGPCHIHVRFIGNPLNEASVPVWGNMRRVSCLFPALAFVAFAGAALPVHAQTGPNATSASATRIVPPQATEAQPERRAGAYGMLANFSSSFVTVQTQYSANVISETFAAALQSSRDAARTTSLPIPEAVIKGLIPFYPEELLRDVRYSIGDPSKTGLAGFAIRNGNAAAVTLIDTIVFKDESYVNSLALWAHEMHHVQQYRDWGLSGFAVRYAFGWNDVEAEASDRAAQFVTWYRDRMGLK